MKRKEQIAKQRAEHENAPLYQVNGDTPEIIEFESITTQVQRKLHESGYNFIKIWGRKDGKKYFLGQADVLDFQVAPQHPIVSTGDYFLWFLSVDVFGSYQNYFRAKFLIKKRDLPYFSTASIVLIQKKG